VNCIAPYFERCRGGGKFDDITSIDVEALCIRVDDYHVVALEVGMCSDKGEQRGKINTMLSRERSIPVTQVSYEQKGLVTVDECIREMRTWQFRHIDNKSSKVTILLCFIRLCERDSDASTVTVCSHVV